jgi:hypothetical protein
MLEGGHQTSRSVEVYGFIGVELLSRQGTRTCWSSSRIELGCSKWENKFCKSHFFGNSSEIGIRLPKAR